LTLASVVAASLASGTTEALRVHAGLAPGTAANYGVPVEPGANRFMFNNSTTIGSVGMNAGLHNGGVHHRQHRWYEEGTWHRPLYQSRFNDLDSDPE
jgi:hypothetical protein